MPENTEMRSLQEQQALFEDQPFGSTTSPKARPSAVLAANGKTCKDCEHRVRTGYHNKVYQKCGLVKSTNGTGTDIRLKDPACIMFEPEKETV